MKKHILQKYTLKDQCFKCDFADKKTADNDVRLYKFQSVVCRWRFFFLSIDIIVVVIRSNQIDSNETKPQNLLEQEMCEI